MHLTYFVAILFALLSACGASEPITKPVLSSQSRSPSLPEKLRIGSHTPAPTAKCLAQETARYYETHAKLPGDYDFMRAASCCGSSAPPESLVCQSGDIEMLNRWLSKQTVDKRTGAIGVGYSQKKSTHTLCLLRLGPEILQLQPGKPLSLHLTPTDPSTQYFARFLTQENELIERSPYRNAQNQLTVPLPESTVSIELHQNERPLSSAQVTYSTARKSQCGVRATASESRLRPEDVLHQFNAIRKATNLPLLTPTNTWYGPLTAWLDRLDDATSVPPIVGLLDHRGWALPRYEVLRIYASTASEFQGLASMTPSLFRLLRAPAMTHISVIPTKRSAGFLIVLFHLPQNSSQDIYEKAFMKDLNRFRVQIGNRPIRQLTRPPPRVDKTDCSTALKALKQRIRSKAVKQIWMRVVLNNTTEHSQPSCTLQYGFESDAP